MISVTGMFRGQTSRQLKQVEQCQMSGSLKTLSKPRSAFRMTFRVRKAVNSPDAHTAEQLPHWMHARIALKLSVRANSSTISVLNVISLVMVNYFLFSNFVIDIYEAFSHYDQSEKTMVQIFIRNVENSKVTRL